MAGFGGAVKLKGESEYKKALNQITQNLKEVSSEMKAVSSAYDKNDKSTEAVKAQTKELNKVLDAQKQKVKTLKDQYSDLSKQYQTQTQKHEALVKSYDKEKAKLDEIGRKLGTASKEYQEQKAKVEEMARAVAKSSQAQDANAKSMSQMRIQINNAQADVNNTTKAIDDLGNEAEDAGKQAEDAGNGGFTVLKGVLSNLASQAITACLNGLKEMGAKLVDVGKSALDSYADYEQLSGGIETLFGAGGKSVDEYAKSVGKSVESVKGEYAKLQEAQDKVMEYANNAYKTAGLSANEYMDTVTGFSSALISSLGGDTVKAASYADRAITDMSDNANKMGTDMASIQNAYQGFAKQNYGMLDNLKLGYGGTKSEMQRLIADAAKMTDVQKELGVTVDASSMSFGNIVNAISVMQKKMGITGTTAKEAATTISGSVGMMKASWQNLLTGMADDNADFEGLINDFVDSLIAVGNNIIPRVQTIITGMAKMLGGLIQEVVPQLVQMIPPLLEQTVPLLVDAVTSLVSTVLEVLPTVVPVVVDGIMQIAQGIVALLPEFVDAGLQMITSIIEGVTKAIPKLLGMLPKVIQSLVKAISDNLPEILEAGAELLVTLAEGIEKTIPELVKMMPTIIQSIVTALTTALPVIIDAGVQILTALIEGLTETIPMLVKMLPTIIETIITVLIDNLPLIIEAGVEILLALIDGLIKTLPELIAMTPQIITTIVSTLAGNMPKILESGKKILKELVNGIKDRLPDLKEIGGKIIKTITNALSDLPGKMFNVGKNVVKGIWNGINDTLGWILDKIRGFGDAVLNGIKNIFGIHSPSTVMRDEVGKYLAQGIGEGFTDEMQNVAGMMEDAIPTSFDVDSTLNTSGFSGTSANSFENIVSAFKQALSEMKIEMDDEEMGKFVDKTVTRLVYN